jgi:gluconolactonase
MLRSIWEVKTAFQGLDHPESLNFGPDGLLFAGGEAGQVYRIDITHNLCTEIAKTQGGFILGVAVDGAGSVYVCDCVNRCVWRVSADGMVKKIVHSIEGQGEKPIYFPNYGVFDDQGNYYVTDSGEYWRPTGRLIRVTPEGTTRSILGKSLSFPNGLALSADGKHVFMIESTANRVLSIPVEKDGAVGTPEIYAQMPGNVPDGLALDSEGNLYVSCYTPEVIFKVSPNRAVEVLLQDPTAEILNRPTNLAFSPDGSTQLYISNFGSHSISMVDVGVPGQKLHYPHL